MAKKKSSKMDEPDEETMAVIEWCIQVEGLMVAAGATQREAQDYIEDNVDWFTDMFFDGLTPEQAAKESLNDPGQ
jgi:hypothetical protein